MGTQKQIEAGRLNGSTSRSPVTAEGKATSSRNGVTRRALACIMVQGKDESKLIDIYRSQQRSMRECHNLGVEHAMLYEVKHFRSLKKGRKNDSPNRSSNEPETDLIALYSTLALAEQTDTDSSASSHL